MSRKVWSSALNMITFGLLLAACEPWPPGLASNEHNEAGRAKLRWAPSALLLLFLALLGALRDALLRLLALLLRGRRRRWGRRGGRWRGHLGVAQTRRAVRSAADAGRLRVEGGRRVVRARRRS